MKIEITRLDLRSGKAIKLTDSIAEEKPLQILVNKYHYATVFCSPSSLTELATGHLLSEGVLKSVEEIKESHLLADEAICEVKLKSGVNIQKRRAFSRLSLQVSRSVRGNVSPCRLSTRPAKVKSTLTVQARTLLKCIDNMSSRANVFKETGGVHAAAIYDKEGNEKALAEDVGRHNAVDKVIGAGAMNHIAFNACFLALSGRLTADIVLKAATMQIPIVASVAAAIDSGIAVANEASLTLAGFVRGNRMNVYTFPERIIS